MAASTMNIQMVDLKGQYRKIQEQVDQAVMDVIRSGAFINGPAVRQFQAAMEAYLQVNQVIPCANGTDALQIAMMALDLQPGDEVIVPAFTYVSTAEVIALLGLTPILIDVDPNTFNITAEYIEGAITERTKAIVPVNLFGQSCDMESIMALAEKYQLWVVEDNAQAIGADYTFSNGKVQKTGTIGHIGCTSFYPSKNLGAFGDGGAIYSNHEDLAAKCRLVANHGQNKRYYHAIVGVNSRLDSIQAAILNIKLGLLDEYAAARRQAADFYDHAFKGIPQLQTPVRDPKSSHVFHQYTLIVKEGNRNELKEHLSEKGIPSMIYYPVALNDQEAFKQSIPEHFERLTNTDYLIDRVISLPMHTELDQDTLGHIVDGVKSYF